MIRNYFKIAIRNLSRNKTYAVINILGLAIAFLCSTLLFLNAINELSYDDHHPDKERIFKLYNYSVSDEKGERGNGSMGLPMAPAIKREVPLTEAVTRFMWNEGEVEYNGKKMSLQVNLVDDDFFTVFSPRIVNGNRVHPLRDLGNTVLTKYAAKRLFGNEEPVGKRIKLKVTGEWKELTVSAVTEDFPDNTSIKYDVLARPELRVDYATEKDDWNHQNHDVYIKLRASVTQEQAEANLAQLAKKYLPGDTIFLKSKGYRKDAYGNFLSVLLLPIQEMHFNHEVGSHNAANSKSYIYTILLISFFILAIACFNFINLNVARAFTRTKEVGVRKCLGAGKKQIFLQIWGESLLISLTALLIGLILAVLLFPYFNQIFKAGLKLSFFYQPASIAMLIVSVLLISLCAGGYPALVISRFSISGVLKGNASLKRPGLLRNSLIVLQFSAACVLMACTLIAYKQFEYIRTMPLGYNKEAVISVAVANADGRDVVKQFRNRLGSMTSIVSISGSNINIGLGKDGGMSKSTSGFSYKDKNILSNWMTVDYDFLKTMDIRLLKGRDLSREHVSDLQGGVLVTESMAKQFGVTDPIGLKFQMDSMMPELTIVGIIPDFHLYSLHEKMDPLTLDISPETPLRYVFIKTRSNNPAQVMKLVEDTYKQIFPGQEFTGSFLNENTDRWYQKEKRLSTLLGISALVAVVLSCFGLFALALLMIRQRVKEIGVRKVLGASVLNINNLLAKDFLKLVLVALVISVPFSWWAMNNWLRDFPYRTTISWYLFAAVGIAAILVSAATISFHTIKAALTNPVNSLRSE